MDTKTIVSSIAIIYGLGYLIRNSKLIYKFRANKEIDKSKWALEIFMAALIVVVFALTDLGLGLGGSSTENNPANHVVPYIFVVIVGIILLWLFTSVYRFVSYCFDNWKARDWKSFCINACIAIAFATYICTTISYSLGACK